MAKLYPPNILNSLPSFYKPGAGSGELSVPFLMNKTVSEAQIRGLKLRLKTTNTDTTVLILSTQKWEYKDSSFVATFTLQPEDYEKLSVGRFYKAQLAYEGHDGVLGFYSTLSVIKFTAKPEVSVLDCSIATTTINQMEYIGSYSNFGDTTEKVYEYKFSLYDNTNNLIETSGWKLHNVYGDESANQSVNKYLIKTELIPNAVYKIQYTVRTNNNLVINSPKYRIMQADSINPEVNFSILANLNYENATIDIKLQAPLVNGQEPLFSGMFVLLRASSDTNFSVWTVINKFQLMVQEPSKYSYTDYTIEHGITYQYAIQQYNGAEIYSNKIYSNQVLAEFEDIYLYDGKRQLRVRFNPAISTFKTNHLDTKKTTIGSQFPFIFRNGAVAYKEFPINGLISYAMDENEQFLSRGDDLQMPDDYGFVSNITDENIAYERRFKLTVLDWLSDGEIKLFKSPMEGNYLVRLMNVQLTPVTQVGRMLHNFSCQASEVAEYSVDNLVNYNFITVEIEQKGKMTWRSVEMSSFYDTVLEQAQNNAMNANTVMGTIDICDGLGYYQLSIQGAFPGTEFWLGEQGKASSLHIVIGSTGNYEIFLDSPVKGLYQTNNFNMSRNCIITYSVYTTVTNKFDKINNVQVYDIALARYEGANNNIFADYVDLKHSVTKIHMLRFSQKEVIEVPSRDSLVYYLYKDNLATETGRLMENVLYFTIKEQAYYKIINGQLVALTKTDAQGLTHYSVPDSYVYFGHYETNSSGEKYEVIDSTFSVLHDNTITLTDFDTIPDFIRIGERVIAEMSMQITIIDYGVEENLINARRAYESAYENWRAISIQLVQATEKDKNNYPIFVFEHNVFRFIPIEDRSNIAGVYWRSYDKAVDSAIDLNEAIETARANYDEAKNQYMTILEVALAQQEEDLIQ